MSPRAERRDAEFRAFVEASGPTLLHAARLLTGDHHRAEDLVQGALIKLYLRWSRIGEPLAYARRALVTGYIDTTRRRMSSERPVGTVPDAVPPTAAGVPAGVPDAIGAADERDGLRRLLAGLEPRERALVVLRYYCDLSEQQAAAELGLPLGTVKSTTSRALARLRVATSSPDTASPDTATTAGTEVPR